MAKCNKCGKKGLFFKVNAEGLCSECNDLNNKQTIEELKQQLKTSEEVIVSKENKNKELELMLTPEMKDVMHLKTIIDELSIKKSATNEKISRNEQELKKLKYEIETKKKEIIVNDEIIELEEFSFYKPRFNFINSDEYKSQLGVIREKQKLMIKNKTAATGVVNWTVDGNAAQGRKMVSDTIKLCLRAFNNECDTSVSAVKFNTYDRCLLRIEKSYDTIKKLGVIMNISISAEYKLLKIKELQLALEYANMKQKEKEELKELRAQQREEARLAKEIEEARKAAYKEQAHYKKAYGTLLKQIETCSSDVEMALLTEKEKEIKEHLETIDSNLKDIDYREANQRAGYVYVISNIGSFGEDIYKIGMTRRLEPTERVYELGDASVPYNFDIHAMIFSNDAPSLENALHKAFEDKKLNMINQRREFFEVSLDEIKKVVKENHDKTVEFIDLPDAEQYRESLKLKEQYYGAVD